MVIMIKPSKLWVIPFFWWGAVIGSGGCLTYSLGWFLRNPLTVSTVLWTLMMLGIEVLLGMITLSQALEHTRWFWPEAEGYKWCSLRSKGKLRGSMRVLCQRQNPTGPNRNMSYPVSLIQSDDPAGVDKVLIEEQWLSWTARQLSKKVSRHLQIDSEDRIVVREKTLSKQTAGRFV